MYFCVHKLRFVCLFVCLFVCRLGYSQGGPIDPAGPEDVGKFCQFPEIVGSCGDLLPPDECDGTCRVVSFTHVFSPHPGITVTIHYQTFICNGDGKASIDLPVNHTLRSCRGVTVELGDDMASLYGHCVTKEVSCGTVSWCTSYCSQNGNGELECIIGNEEGPTSETFDVDGSNFYLGCPDLFYAGD
jgi:hypothetical protein